MSRSLTAAAAGSLLLGAVPASADVVVLTPVKDCVLHSEDGAAANCDGDAIFAGNTKDQFRRRSLVAFDVVSVVPSGATVSAAVLQLFVSRTKASTENVSLHRLLGGWGEGTSHPQGEEGTGTTATVLDATWSHAFWPTTTWASPGADWVLSASATAAVGKSNTSATWSSPGLADDVQAWVDDPSSNYGWVLRGNELGSQTAKRFESGDSTDIARRPTLTVTFTTALATGACCLQDGSCGVVLDPGSACTSGTYQGSGVACSPNPCPQPTGVFRRRARPVSKRRTRAVRTSAEPSRARSPRAPRTLARSC